MTDKFVKPSFNIIRYRGQPNKATTLDGYNVYRQEKLFVPELGRFVQCAPYDDHFIYEEPSGKPGRSSYMCTCGSAAIVAGFSGYEGQASPSGFMLLCLLHATHGHHTNSLAKWV